MAVQAGIKIGVEGEREYRQALSNINQQTKELTSEMNLLTSSFDKNASAEEKNAAKAKILQQQIDNQANKVALLTDKYNREQSELARLKAEMERATAEYGENSKEAQKATAEYTRFATQTSKTKTDLNKAKTELNKMTKELDSAQNPTQEEAEALGEVKENAKEAGQEGIKFGDILKANVISDIIVGGVKALARAVADVAKGMRDTVVDTVKWADDLATLSITSGLSTERLQELQYMAGLVDVEVTTVTDSLTKMVRSMNTAAGGTGDAAEAYAALGVSVTDANGGLRDQNTVFNEVIDALGGVGNETQRDAYAMAIFGRSARELNPLIEAGSGKLADLADEAHNVGYVLDNDTIGSLAAVQDALDRLQNAGDEIKRTFVTSLAPALTKMLDTVVPAVQEIAKAVGSLLSGDIDIADFVDLIMGWVDRFSENIRSRLPDIIEQGGRIIVSLTQGISTQLPRIMQSAAEVVNSLTAGLLTALPELGRGAVNLVLTIINTMTEHTEELIQTATDMAISLVSGLLSAETLTSIVKAGVGLVQAVVRGALSAIPEIIKAAPKIVIGLIEGMMESSILVAEAGIELLTALVDNLPYIIETLASSMGELVAGLVLALVRLAPRIAEAGVDLLVALVKNAPAIIKAIVMIIPDIVEALTLALVDAAPDIASAGVESFSHLFDHFGEIWEEIKKNGKETIDNFIAGVLSMWSSLKSAGREALKQFGNGLAELFPDAYQWGRDMINNFTSGIRSASAGLTSTVSGVARGIRNILGFSEPTEGALSNFHTYAPDMMKLYAEGIRDNAYLVEDAAAQVAYGVASSFGTTNAQTLNMGGVSIVVNGAPGQDVEELADLVMEQMQNAVERKKAVYA